ncbi:hypothetical protein B1756_14415 [Natrarchaeobaculum aegyptiacum]|uniref:Uncharacterized protein n=1 Tax=Natrarchaeobaculum aegyptiacum TaxID=745377 RepID=A0A2Z2HYF7_9EURY|nr:hypothetical protein B1756_14415 [Natrarchaeobaculum aegyptiacum]
MEASSQDSIAEVYFDSFREVDQADRGQIIVECADALCVEERISDETTDEIVTDVDRINHHIRRVRFGARILNDHNLTTAITESQVQEIGDDVDRLTRFTPLVGSLNNLQAAACAIKDDPEPGDIESFLYASLAFGLEVALWQSTAPYQMAWNGTRFVSNRTFLRYANHGCNGCIALAMSELHWALRAVPYSLASEDRVEFVVSELEEVRATANDLDYDVEIDIDREIFRESVGELNESTGIYNRSTAFINESSGSLNESVDAPIGGAVAPAQSSGSSPYFPAGYILLPVLFLIIIHLLGDK